MTEPILDLLYLESHSVHNMVIADISTYGNATISTPTVEITPPGFPIKSIPFVAQSIQVYNSTSLGITSVDCDPIALPDGIYKIKYSIAPAYKYYVIKNFLRVDKLIERFDLAYLKLDINQCDLAFKTQEKKTLDLIWSYINGAIASANNCAEKQAMDLYTRAWNSLEKFLQNQECDG